MGADPYQRLGAKTQFSSAAAEALYRAKLAEAGVTVPLGQPLESVEMKGNRIISATFETGLTIKDAIFIDATYEGDPMAAANVSYTVGHEQRGTYDVSLAGQWQTVSSRSIVPKKAECENLLVPLSLSASHVAFGSIRMEPVFMILGQSAGTSAIAIAGKQAVQDVSYERLKELLLKQGQEL
ncbi:MAG: FAD-dependent oxidoreductase [Akkermansiaceae bacterium]|jgi:hypothetical protein|nr:FAD-dependent oxidoreductase [Akkermansiaceae bacterium]